MKEEIVTKVPEQLFRLLYTSLAAKAVWVTFDDKKSCHGLRLVDGIDTFLIVPKGAAFLKETK